MDKQAIIAAIEADGGAGEYGIRVLPDDDAAQVGDLLAPSLVWDDGECTGEELPGTCAIGVTAETVDSAMRLVLANGYSGKRLALIVGDRAQSGEDAGERIIRDAVVLLAADR